MDNDFQGRVFPKDTFSVVFSKTRAQDDQALTFSFSPTQTTASGLESQTWNEKSIFKFGSLNDFAITFTNNSIVFINTKTESSIALSGGVYEELRFIGFHSDILTTWILLESTHDVKGSFNSHRKKVSIFGVPQKKISLERWTGMTPTPLFPMQIKCLLP